MTAGEASPGPPEAQSHPRVMALRTLLQGMPASAASGLALAMVATEADRWRELFSDELMIPAVTSGDRSAAMADRVRAFVRRHAAELPPYMSAMLDVAAAQFERLAGAEEARDETRGRVSAMLKRSERP